MKLSFKFATPQEDDVFQKKNITTLFSASRKLANGTVIHVLMDQLRDAIKMRRKAISQCAVA
jgi:hypothetical protein